MTKAKIKPSNLEFLKLLKKNNNRDWFAVHKERYLLELSQMEAFVDDLLVEMNKNDVIETPSGKKSLYRIYRDTRFSKDKTPYKNHWAAGFKRATKKRRGGYYFHIEPGNTFAAGGFWDPEPKDLKRIRDEFAHDATPVRKILKNKSFINTFGSLDGEQVKTTPKGFDADNAAIDLIRYKQFLLVHKFSDKEVLADDFLKQVNDTFKKMRPFFDYMTEVLTTDVNGVSTVS
ncbi:MAG: DUF2461 domain-containing protein [Bacteroidota bacterium]